jgi:hypothetical protein
MNNHYLGKTGLAVSELLLPIRMILMPRPNEAKGDFS